MKSVLGFDLGTKTGWAFGKNPDGLIACGLLRTEPNRFESQGMRFIKFERGVRGLLEVYKPDIVAFERVHAHSGVIAAQLFGSYVAILMKMCEEHGVTYEGYPVQAIKKFGTTKHNASKALMLAMAGKKYPHLEFESDDVADAAHLTSLALSNL